MADASMISIAIFLSILVRFGSPDPVPAPWTAQFHSILLMNNTKGGLQVTDLWYDYPNGRNFNIIQNQLGKKLYDLEWDNGTSYIYTLDESRECRTLHFPVGILRPDWLDGATYLGRATVDGFLCNVWEKVDFIWYYEDVVTKRPVYWAFFTGMVAHVMTFEVGKVLDDPSWQAPVYCFEERKQPMNLQLASSDFWKDRSFLRDVSMVVYRCFDSVFDFRFTRCCSLCNKNVLYLFLSLMKLRFYKKLNFINEDLYSSLVSILSTYADKYRKCI